MYKGIDVSQWQGDINWSQVKNSGVEFAIIRSGYGSVQGQEDTRFFSNLRNAKEAGVKVGVYHYSYAQSTSDARMEAEYCLSLVSKAGVSLDLPIYFDIEDNSICSNQDKATITEMCVAFCSRIEQAGYWAGVYANKNWYDNYLNYEDLRVRYTLWLAHYGISEPSLKCDVWQYSSSGSIPGIAGKVDLNNMYRDLFSEIMGTKACNSEERAQKTEATYYTVKSGDSLWAISARLLGDGNRYHEIKGLNNLTSDTIYPGQSLRIPR